MLMRICLQYFCDLFAAQYIGDTLGLFLQYITGNSNTDSLTHPPTTSRVKVISDFVNGVDNPVVNYMQVALQALIGKQFEVSFDKITSDDFYKLIPYDVQNDRELHGSIIYGWEVWLADSQKFNEGMKYDVKLSEETIYRVINNLVEKTIGNYFTVQNWKNSKNE